MKILVTDGSYKHTLGIVRSLGRHGIEVCVLANSRNASSCLSRYCQHAIFSPSPYDEVEFIEFLLSYLQKQQIALLIPVGYKSVEVISKHNIELGKYTSIELPAYAKVQIALNKKSTYQLAKRLEVPCPYTIYPTNQENVGEIASSLTYPVVIKGIHEAGTSYVDYAFDQSQLLQKYQSMCFKHNLNYTNLPMIQEYIRGHGYGFFALYQHGVCKRVFMHRRIRESPPTGGASVSAESFYHDQLKEYGKRLLDELKWHGVAMVEFKLDEKDHQFKLMEINPKFWGSLDLAIAAGVDFPYYLTQMSMGSNVEYSEEYERGLRYHWPLEDFKCARTRPALLLPFLSDLFNPKVKSNIIMHDLRPSLWLLLRLVGTLLPPLLRRMIVKIWVD